MPPVFSWSPSPGALLFGAAGCLLAVNVLAAFLFRIDKERAIAGKWRISERLLLLVALLGGSIGAKYAQRRFRHKTRKQPFAFALDAIVGVQVAAVLLLAAPDVRAAIAEFVFSLAKG